MNKRIQTFLRDFNKEKEQVDKAYLNFLDNNEEILQNLKNEVTEEIENKIVRYQDQIDNLELKISELEDELSEISPLHIKCTSECKHHDDPGEDAEEAPYEEVTEEISKYVNLDKFANWLYDNYSTRDA